MYIICGLGNPGKKYENTHHNMGFITVDQLASKYGIRVEKLKFKALIGEGRIGNEKVILVKPQTYMNLSGESVREVMNFYKEDIEHLIVIYDDIDIPIGTFRIRKKGSAGTHNGMRSVIYQLQDDGFPRIRIGIGKGKPGEGGASKDVHGDDLISYVIGGVTRAEKEPLEDAISKACEACACMVNEGVDMAMNRFNVRPPKPPKKPKQEEIMPDKEIHE